MLFGAFIGPRPIRITGMKTVSQTRNPRYSRPRRAPVAQLDRARSFYLLGRGFDSLRARQLLPGDAMVLLSLSHLVNVIVVTIIPVLIAGDSPAMTACYGPDSAARRILACLYATIAIASAVALLGQASGNAALAIAIAAVLFPMQIAYKLMTLPAVGWRNPVVKSNIAIALLHTVTLAALWQQGTVYVGSE
jgi:hypothetical protein